MKANTLLHLYMKQTWTVQLSVYFVVQLFDAMSLEEVYQPLKPAALYEEALCLVRDNKVAYRSLR